MFGYNVSDCLPGVANMEESEEQSDSQQSDVGLRKENDQGDRFRLGHYKTWTLNCRKFLVKLLLRTIAHQETGEDCLFY